MIEITCSFDKRQWDEFIQKHPQGSIFQTSEMAEVYKLTKNYKPISLAAIDSKSGKILAVLQAVVISEMRGILGQFSTRSIIQGAPLYIEGEEGMKAVSKLIEHYEKIVFKNIVYTEIRNSSNTQEIKGLLEQNGYTYIEHFNALIDLNKPIEELWNQLERDKKRGIKKAEKMGITIETSEIKSDVEIFYGLVKETYNNAKIPLADISLFNSTYDILASTDKALFLFAKDGYNNVIATQLALMYKDTIYAWYTGAIRESLKYYPGDCLIWHLIKYGVENGYKNFDFGGGGSSNKNLNLRQYKMRFGTIFPNYGRYKKIHSPIKNSIAELGLKIYKQYKKCSLKIVD